MPPGVFGVFLCFTNQIDQVPHIAEQKHESAFTGYGIGFSHHEPG